MKFKCRTCGAENKLERLLRDVTETRTIEIIDGKPVFHETWYDYECADGDYEYHCYECGNALVEDTEKDWDIISKLDELGKEE